MGRDKFKIVVTASTYPRWHNDTVPMFVHDQLIHLKNKYPNIQITTLAPHHAGAKKKEMTEYGQVIRYQYFFPLKLQKLVYPAIMPNLKGNKLLYLQVPFLFFSLFFCLLKYVLKNKPDLIYSHWFIPQGLVGGIVGLITNTPHVYTSHSSDVIIAKKIPYIGKVLVRFFSRKAKKITVVSQRTLDRLKSFFDAEEWAGMADKVKVIPMGIDTSAFSARPECLQEIKNKLGYNDRNILLFMGRLTEKKGVRYILEALKDYIKLDPNALLVVGGDGPLLDNLLEQSNALNLMNHVDFVGYVHGKRKIDLFSIADVVLVPSIVGVDGDVEGLPVTLMEAMAAGKICIASDVSGADDIITSEVDGYLITQKSSYDIYRALMEIYYLNDDDKCKIELNVQIKSKGIDWGVIIDEHFECFI